MLVSVIMISYNQEKYIRQAIESVFAQDVDFDIEIIIGDDASQDDTPNIIAELAEQDARLIPILREKNLGMNRNFIDIVNRATGKYLAVLEGDDFWLDINKLKKQVELLENNPDCNICYTNSRIIDENDEFMKNFYHSNEENGWFQAPAERLNFDRLIQGNFINTATVMYRRIEDLEIPEWFYDLKLGDWPFSLFHAESGDLLFLNEITACYRQHSASNWSSKDDLYTNEKTVECFEKLVLKFPNHKEAINESIEKSYKWLLGSQLIKCIDHYNKNEFETANKYVEYCFKIIQDINYTDVNYYFMFSKIKHENKEYELSELYLKHHNEFVLNKNTETEDKKENGINDETDNTQNSRKDIEVKLYDDPNRYAEIGKLEINDKLNFFGYQVFSVDKNSIEVSDKDPKLKRKQDLVKFLFDSSWFEGKSVLDLGANSAFFCFYGLQSGANRADAVEIDKKYVEMVNQAIKELDYNNFEIHDINVMDYTKKADVVFAFALIHWIYSCTSDYGSLTQAVSKLSELTNEILIIEWVDPEDDAIKFFNHIDFNKDIINEPYDLEHFEKALTNSFESWELLGDVKSTRKVYACYKDKKIQNKFKQTEISVSKAKKPVLIYDISTEKIKENLLKIYKERDLIINEIIKLDSDYIILLYFDLLLFKETRTNFFEVDILTNSKTVEILSHRYKINQSTDIYYIELDSQGVLYRINLLNRELEIYQSDFNDYFFSNIGLLNNNIRILNNESCYIYMLFKLVYTTGAIDSSYFIPFELVKEDRINPLDNNYADIQKLSNYLDSFNLFKFPLNKFINDISFKFIFYIENCVSSRILHADLNYKFISRIYKVDEKIVKQANLGLVTNEYKALTLVQDSDYFPKVYNFNSAGKSEYFEMDFIEGYSLDEDIINSELNSSEKLTFVNGLLDILEILKSKNISHRDINANNIIVKVKRPVLIDFGWAVNLDAVNPFTPGGLNGKYRTPKDELSDVYAVAKTIEDYIEGDFSELIELMKSNYNLPISEYRKVLNKESKNPDSQKDLPQLIKSLEEQDYEKALEISDRLMLKLPSKTINKSNLHYSKALCLYKLGRYDEAYDAIYSEIIINPDFEEAYNLQSAINEALDSKQNLDYSNYKPEEKVEAEPSDNIDSDSEYEVSIIIPCFNKVQLTEQCLESLFEITDSSIKYEVIVVDNASEDSTPDVCEKFDDMYANFRYIKNDENLGFAKACNQGIEARRGKHALLLNNDIVPTEGWLREMLIVLINEHEAGIVGSCLLYPESEYIQHCGFTIGSDVNNSPSPYHFDMFTKRSENLDSQSVKEMKAVTGACFLIRDELINQIGLLDEDYINGYEDVDYCFQAITNGWKVFYCGKSVLYHFESMSQFRHKYDIANWQRFARKWTGKILPEETVEETKNGQLANQNRQIEINKALEYNYKQVRRSILGKGKDEIEFSVIIPVHSNPEYTIKCLTALNQTSFLHNIEIIIIDNNSDAQTKQILSTLGDFAKVIVNEKNESYSHANNQGAAIAKGNYLVFMNNDVQSIPGWMEAIEDTFEKDETIGIQGAKLLYPTEKIQHAGIVWGPVSELNNMNLHYHIHLLEDGEDPKVNTSKEFQMVTGALLAIRRELFHEVGGFDEKYYFGHEDLDLCMKVRKAGYKVWYNHQASAYHYESMTKKDVGMEKFERFFKSEESYDKANHEYFLSKWADTIEVDADKHKSEKSNSITTKSDSDKKRILFTMYGWNEVGGGTTFPKAVAKGLVLKGYEVYVIYAAGNHEHIDTQYYTEEATDEGVNLIGIYNRPVKFLDYEKPEREIRDDRIVTIFERYLDKIDPDIVNYHNFIGLSYGIVQPTLDRNIKTIFTPYNYHPIDPKLYMFTDDMEKWRDTDFFANSDVPDLDRKHDLYSQRINVAKKSINSCDLVLAVSDRQAEIYNEFGIYPEIIYKVNQIHDNVSVIKAKENYTVGKPLRVGFIGAVIPQKGIQTLIAACSQIDANDLELHIYGYIDSEYRSLLQSINVQCEMVFHGAYDKNQFNEIANKLDVVVVPSIWEDCAPFVVQEALAMGLPVIGSDLGGISDFIEDGYNGIIYDHSNSIELRDILLDIISNPQLLIDLQKNCNVPLSFNDYLNHLSKIYNIAMNDEPLKREDIELNFKEKLLGKQVKDTIMNENISKSVDLYINLDGTYSGDKKNIYSANANQSLFDSETRQLKLEDDFADSITLEKVIEYYEDGEIQNLLNEIKRVLKPSGKLEIIVPDIEKMGRLFSTGEWSLSVFNSMMFEKSGRPLVNTFNSVRLNEILKAQNYNEIEISQKDANQTEGVRKPLVFATGVKSASANSAEQLKKGYQYSEDYRPQLNIVWEGTQFVHHSLALINREQCSNIIDAEVANLTIVPYEPEKFNPKDNEKYEKLYWHDIRVKQDDKPKEKLPYVWIRHQWPPKNEAPKGAKWIINQPWEFSLLTKDLKETFDNADEIWTPTTWCRNVYIDSGIDSDKIQVIPNGIDPQLFTPYGKKLPLKTNKKIKFLFVGGTIYRKGIDILLDTFVSTFTKHDDVCLVIKDMGGDSFYKGQTAKEYINKLQLINDTPDIEYIDEMLDEKDIAALYRACDVFVSPYRGEGFSLPTLEAMACGLPVIVTKDGATDDFVDESVGWRISASKKALDMKMGDRTFVGQAHLLEPDTEHFSSILREAYDSSTSLISVGLLASHRARTNFTWRKSTIKSLKRLDFLYGTEMAPKAMVKLPEIVDAYILLGEAEQAFNNFDYDTALALYKQVVESGELSDDYEALALKETVLIMINIGNYELAHEFLESFNPADVDYQYLKAKVLAFGGEFEEALDMQTVIMDNWQRLKHDSQISLTLDHILAFTGEIMATMGDLDSALQVYQAALEINENNIDALFGIGEILLENGDAYQAKDYLERTLQIYPQHEEAADLLEGILQSN